MVAATCDEMLLMFDRRSGLPECGVGSKVDKSHRRNPRLNLAPAAALEVFVTSRLRELIQQLGEAIHESVIESEQIAGVVQDIRRHGFDVLLMLEATIGLNEVSAKEPDAAGGEAEAGEEGPAGRFTSNDLSFLRSLRISVEGEDDSSDDSENEAETDEPGE